MRKSKFSETQIVAILKGAESGVPVADLLRKYGVSKATFVKWRSKYGGASVSDVKRLRELETENAKLKRMGRTLPAREAVSLRAGERQKRRRPWQCKCQRAMRRGA
jgi:putative transposase